MKIILSVVLLLSFAVVGKSSREVLTIEAKQLQYSYNNLLLRPSDRDYQLEYLKHFPRDAGTFNRLFNPKNKQQLYDGNEYVFVLENLSQTHGKTVLSLLLNLAAELRWTPDAPNYLQLVLMKIALNNPIKFAEQYHRLSSDQKQNVVTFLNAGNNGPAAGYSQLIYVLKRIKHTELANQLRQGMTRGNTKK